MINKVSKTFNYLYLTVLMIFVVSLLLLNFLKEGVISLFKDKKTVTQVKNNATQKSRKSTKYIITNSHTTNS
jgi:uncharacterized membrane protein affecting hemolysin expression